MSALFESSLKSLPFLHRGKVRDLYAVGDDKLLVIQTDRLSAFDVILPTPVPGKGRVLTALSNFWFEKLGHVIPNHLTGIDPATTPARCAAPPAAAMKHAAPCFSSAAIHCSSASGVRCADSARAS